MISPDHAPWQKHFRENLCIAEKGEFSAIPDALGNVYVADGQVYIFNKEGKQTGMIAVPERPSTITFGGKDLKTLFITGKHELYRTEIF